jgi:hypothetical protein
LITACAGILVLLSLSRQPAATSQRLAAALASLLAAAAAFAVALRGLWPAALVLAIVSLVMGGAWARRRNRPATTQEMAVREARDVLGVPEGASRDEIDAAWRRLMLRAHPDHGGTSGLAARINAARARLLKG